MSVGAPALAVAALLVGVFVVGLLLVFGGRAFAVRAQHRHLLARAARVRGLVEEHVANGFLRVDRLLLELGGVGDADILDGALRAIPGDLAALDDAARERLRGLYGTLGLLDLHLERLRGATEWRDRADSATLLAELQEVRAVPILVAVLCDPFEDASTVKNAALRALTRMRADGTAEALLAALRGTGDRSAPRVAELLVQLGDTALRPCLEALGDESVSVRSWAAQVLGHLAHPDAVEPLRSCLDDRAHQVRLSAAEALGRMADPRAVLPLVRLMLRDPMAQVRAEAARALGVLQAEEAHEALISALDDPDHWTRLRAIEALELLAPDEPDLLVRALHDDRQEVRRAAAIALARLGCVQAWIEALAGSERAEVALARGRLAVYGRSGSVVLLARQLQSHPDFRVRARLAEVLGEVADPTAGSALSAALRDAEWPVRAASLAALASVGGRDLDGVLALLADDEEAVRDAAAEALVTMGPLVALPPEALDRVAEQCGSRNLPIRGAALDLLERQAPERAQTAAIERLGDSAPTMRAAAVRILARRGDEAIPLLLPLLDDPDRLVQRATADALATIETPLALRTLVQAAVGADRDAREALSTALARQPFARVAEVLDEFMASEGVEERLAAVWTLGKTGDPRAIPLLAATLGDERRRVRAAAAGALARFEDIDALRALRGALRDPCERCRAAVVNALGRRGDHEDLSALNEMLDDPDPFVRGRALVALGRLETPDPTRLVAALGGRDTRESVAAATALCLLGARQSMGLLGPWLRRPGHLPALLQQLESEPEEVTTAVRSVLDLLPASHDAAVIAAWAVRVRETLAGARDPRERLLALELLRSWPDVGRAASLERALATDPDPGVRVRVVELLPECVDQPVPALIRALRDPARAVRDAALLQAGRWPELGKEVMACGEGAVREDVVAALVAQHRGRADDLEDLLMADDATGQRAAAALALGRLGDPGSARLLGHLVADPDAGVRLAAVQALDALRGEDVVAALLDALRSPWEEVRSAALSALGRAAPERLAEAAESLRDDPSSIVRLAVALALAAARRGAAESST